MNCMTAVAVNRRNYVGGQMYLELLGFIGQISVVAHAVCDNGAVGKYSIDSATLFVGTYSVGAFSLIHHDRFPCEHDLSSRKQGIHRLMYSLHVFAPLKRGVVIVRKAACNFARACRAIRSICDKA